MKLLQALSLAFLPIMPGQSWTNGDHVRVSVRPASLGAATLLPILGNPGASSAVRFEAGCKGSAQYLDFTDRVTVDAGAVVYIQGCPKSVTLAAGCVARISNHWEPPPTQGGPVLGFNPSGIRVHLPQGQTAWIMPGSEWTFTP